MKIPVSWENADQAAFGEKGCSAIFGPQNGATSAMIEHIDQWLELQKLNKCMKNGSES